MHKFIQDFVLHDVLGGFKQALTETEGAHPV